MCDVRQARKQDPQSDLERNLQNDRYPWPMHILITMAMKGLLGLSHIFERYLLNTRLENENVHTSSQALKCYSNILHWCKTETNSKWDWKDL